MPSSKADPQQPERDAAEESQVLGGDPLQQDTRHQGPGNLGRDQQLCVVDGADRPTPSYLLPPARDQLDTEALRGQALARVRAAFLALLLRRLAFSFRVRAAFFAAALRFWGPWLRRS